MIDKLLGDRVDQLFVKNSHQYPANEIAIGDVHLFLFEEILKHVGDIPACIANRR